MVFPGQGSQSVGMLGELAASHPIVERTFREAGEVLGYDQWTLITQGPKEQLDRTEFTQPAMLAAGIATWRAWTERGGARPDFVSGHSLGEYSALVAAEALGFADALRITQFRGRAMQDAVPVGQGGIAAILGVDDAEVIAACQEAAQGKVVEPVNFNAPGQIVIAGEIGAVQRAIEAAKARGAKRAVMLPMSVPAHSSLMAPAAQRLRERLASIAIATPRIRYVSGVDACEHSDPESIRDRLARQPAQPVRWTDVVRALLAAGVTRFIECGPGRVLTPMVKRVEKRADVSYVTVDDPTTLDAGLALKKSHAAEIPDVRQ
jgi:[acyl-carrier-protein] S-malonyltransferase